MAVIKKVGDGFKRLCAVLVACVVMWYCVITAPVFRVHGALNILDQLSACGDFLRDTFKNATSALGFLPDGLSPEAGLPGLIGNYIIDAGYAIWGTDGLADQYSDIFQDITNTGNASSINFSTTHGFSGYYNLNGNLRSGSFYTRDMSSLLSNTYFNIYSTQDFTLCFRALPSSGYGPEDMNLSINFAISGALNEYVFRYQPSCNVPFIPEFTLYYLGDTIKKIYPAMTSAQFGFIIRNQSTPVVYPSDASSLLDYFLPTASSSSFLNSSCVALALNQYHPGNQSWNWPSGNTTELSYNNFEDVYNYYNNYVTPYYQNTYPGDNITYYNVDYYYDIIQSETTAPSETTSPGTGVIIIDPFTLPPDWVQSDVVELETDHYEVPFESMVADPFDYLVSPYTQTSTETVRGATKSVPISPPTPQYQVFPSSGNVQETAVGFVNLAYTLLNRSGLDYVIGIAVFGLCVSLLVL